MDTINYNVPVAIPPYIPGSDNTNTTYVDKLSITEFTDGTMTLSNNIFSNLIDPVTSDQAATKHYVDSIPFNIFKNFDIQTKLATVALNFTTALYWLNVEWSNDLHMFVEISFDYGQTNLFGYSSDGLVWTSVQAYTSAYWTDIVYIPDTSPGKFVVSGNSVYLSPGGFLIESIDGLNWTLLNDTSFGQYFPTALVWNPIASEIVCTVNNLGAETNIIFLSEDAGITFTTHFLTTSAMWSNIAYSIERNRYVAIANNKNFCNISSNGTSWTQISLTTRAAWSHVIWAAEVERYVISAYGSKYLQISSNGIVWTSASHTASGNWTQVTWAPQTFTFIAYKIFTNTIEFSADAITWFSESTTSAAIGQYWAGAITWSPILETFVIISSLSNIIILNSSYPTSVTYNPLQIINTFIKRSGDAPILDTFPTGDSIYTTLLNSLGHVPPIGYTFETNIANISTNISYIITIDLNVSGIVMANNQSPNIILQKDSFVVVYIIYQGLVSGVQTFSAYYISPYNYLNISIDNEASQYTINDVSVYTENSLDTRLIYEVSEFNGIQYTKEYVLNSVINRTNTPAIDILPSKDLLIYPDIENNSSYVFTVRNLGTGLLTIKLGDIGIDYNNDENIFITLGSQLSSTCILVYNESLNNFFAYELDRGSIM